MKKYFLIFILSFLYFVNFVKADNSLDIKIWDNTLYYKADNCINNYCFFYNTDTGAYFPDFAPSGRCSNSIDNYTPVGNANYQIGCGIGEKINLINGNYSFVSTKENIDPFNDCLLGELPYLECKNKGDIENEILFSIPTNANDNLKNLSEAIIYQSIDLSKNVFSNFWPFILVICIIAGFIAFILKKLKRKF